MRVEKIDIKKEVMDIPDGHDRWICVEFPPITSRINDGQLEFSQANVPTKIHTYFVTEEYGNVRNVPPKKYLIEVDDRGLFNHLVQVSDLILKQLVDNRVEILRRKMAEGHLTDLALQRAVIKRLSWWRRLFNKF